MNAERRAAAIPLYSAQNAANGLAEPEADSLAFPDD